MTEPVSLLEQISRDRALGSAVLFPHRHPQETPPFHIEIIDLWRSKDENVLIEAFREAAKSTLSEEHLCLEGCFGNFHYWLLLGETYTKACQRLAAIDYEARTNSRLHKLFGGEVLAKKSTENRVFFKSGALIEAVGWEQELQSFKYHDHRPEGAWLDDVENAERVRDKGAVDASMHKLFLELIPALDKTRRRIRITQTRRAEDCMVTRLAKNPEWVYRAYPIADRDPDDPEAASLWPDRYPIEWIRREMNSYRSGGMLPEFKQAYLLQATDPESKPFKEAMLAEMDLSPWHWMPRYAIYDPSRTSNRERTATQHKSDRFGKVVVSRMGSKILVHESSGEYWQPDEFMDDLFRTHEKHAPTKIGVEKNSLDDWILQPIRIAMMRRGVSLPIKALQAPQDRSKEQFIQGLQPFATARDIVLVGGKAAHSQLVAEWCNFPQGPRDIMNALAYSLQLFAGTPVYEDFSGQNIGDAPGINRGDEIYVAFNASPAEVVAVAVIRDQRRLCVARDWAGFGSLSDAVKTLAFNVRATYPGAAIQAWVPAETFDQWQRIPLVPALRTERITPYRAEHTAVARGSLSERIRTRWHDKQLLTVDSQARLTLNALAAGYALPPGKQQAEEGTSRLIAEALECMVAQLDHQDEAFNIPAGANLGISPSGATYVTANPRRR